MKTTKLFVLILLVFALTACGGGNAAPATPAGTPPPVVADNTIVAEGRVEPINYAAVAYNASGVISVCGAVIDPGCAAPRPAKRSLAGFRLS